MQDRESSPPPPEKKSRKVTKLAKTLLLLPKAL